MTDRPRNSDPMFSGRGGYPGGLAGVDGEPRSATLADVLELVLDKGIVIAGDIQVNLLEIELLTIRLRLLIASVDKAREMGINWWEGDPMLSSGPGELNGDESPEQLGERVAMLERQLAELTSGSSGSKQGGRKADT